MTSILTRPAVLAIAAVAVAAGFAPASASAETAVAVTSFAEQRVVTFDTATPGSLDSSATIKGLRRRELVVGLDLRPATGDLYAQTSAGRLGILDPATGVLSPTAEPLPFGGGLFGVDFNPSVDRLRSVNTNDGNFRTDVDTDTTTADTPLSYAAGDPNAGRDPRVSAAAYTNNVAGAQSTVLYDIDSGLDVLAKQDPDPNGGRLTTVGRLGLNTVDETGFDISGETGTAFAILTPSSPRRSNLYRVNLETGAATPVGPVGPFGRYSGLTIVPPRQLSLTLLGRAGSGVKAGAEIADYHPATRRVFVTNAASNAIDVFDIANPAAPVARPSIPLAAYGAAPNSVDVSRDGIVAVAVEATVKQDPGQVVFFDTSGNLLGQQTVGALPDMVTFTPDGSRVLVANEGEPNSYGQMTSRDPEGSVSIVTPPGRPPAVPVTLGFTAVAPVGPTHGGAPGTTFAQNAEPEYITVSSDSSTAWVTLQETNAVAKIDLSANAITLVRGLGRKDHGATGAGLDPSDRDGTGGGGANNIAPRPNVEGLFQPDAIASYRLGGRTLLATANEGDARDYTGFSEEIRVGSSSYSLDAATFPNAATLKQNANLGRLNVTRIEGDTEPDGDFDRIVPFGARSLSILDADAQRTFDTGDQLEQETAARQPSIFNSDGLPANFDTRSDNKGPEPEGVATGTVSGRPYSFLVNERQGSVFVHDLARTPGEARLAGYSPGGGSDLAPEGVSFVAAGDSPTGRPLVIVSYEVSGTVAVYEVR